jgi:hypothetical protein
LKTVHVSSLGTVHVNWLKTVHVSSLKSPYQKSNLQHRKQINIDYISALLQILPKANSQMLLHCRSLSGSFCSPSYHGPSDLKLVSADIQKVEKAWADLQTAWPEPLPLRNKQACCAHYYAALSLEHRRLHLPEELQDPTQDNESHNYLRPSRRYNPWKCVLITTFVCCWHQSLTVPITSHNTSHYLRMYN